MTENRTNERPCPFCAEIIDRAAARCPHCRGHLERRSPIEAHRNRPGRQVAGVAIALAETFGLSVTLVRLLFIITSFINLIGVAAYALLWLTMPEEAGGTSLLGKLVGGVVGESGTGEGSIFERVVKQLARWADSFDNWLQSKRTDGSKGPPPPPPSAGGEPSPPREQAS